MPHIRSHEHVGRSRAHHEHLKGVMVVRPSWDLVAAAFGLCAGLPKTNTPAASAARMSSATSGVNWCLPRAKKFTQKACSFPGAPPRFRLSRSATEIVADAARAASDHRFVGSPIVEFILL